MLLWTMLLLWLMTRRRTGTTKYRTVNTTSKKCRPRTKVRYTRVAVTWLAGVHALSGALLFLQELLLLTIRSCSVEGETVGLLLRWHHRPSGWSAPRRPPRPLPARALSHPSPLRTNSLPRGSVRAFYTLMLSLPLRSYLNFFLRATRPSSRSIFLSPLRWLLFFPSVSTPSPFSFPLSMYVWYSVLGSFFFLSYCPFPSSCVSFPIFVPLGFILFMINTRLKSIIFTWFSVSFCLCQFISFVSCDFCSALAAAETTFLQIYFFCVFYFLFALYSLISFTFWLRLYFFFFIYYYYASTTTLYIYYCCLYKIRQPNLDIGCCRYLLMIIVCRCLVLEIRLWLIKGVGSLSGPVPLPLLLSLPIQLLPVVLPLLRW